MHIAGRVWNLSMNGSSGEDWTRNVEWWFGLSAYVDAVVFIKAWRRVHSSYIPLSIGTCRASAALRLASWLAQGKAQNAVHTSHKIPPNCHCRNIFPRPRWAAVFCASHAMHIDTAETASSSLSPGATDLVRVSGSCGFLFLFPDGTLWRWDPDQGVSPPRQIGIATNWVQASVRGNSAVGLRSDGTLWAWNPGKAEPKQVGSSHDWGQAVALNDSYIALKRDGTLWDLVDVSVDTRPGNLGPLRREFLQIGTNRDWKSISIVPVGGTRLALKNDGTLWTWGAESYLSPYGHVGRHQLFPRRFGCALRATWTGFSDEIAGGVRNQAGESVGNFPRDASSRGGSFHSRARGSQVSSNATTSAFGLFFTNEWTLASFETRANGTLWATPLSWRAGYRATALAVSSRPAV